ncbi:MAG: dTDP-4-dehydrorhamnose 3,5-epimerase [Ignavibacteriae bacterium HGW-Ignavibacteriae-3]|nr:MAG: dTDP-4-dehydrorhamnose 3,5-epimerase [Ignavibacteriae bacterium HGW-Ignavibacteriae-3]
MKFEKVFIDGLILVTPDVHADERGYFFETFNKSKFTEGGIDLNFVQDNISKSVRGTVRGLHYQTGDSAQGKLCSVVTGSVLDVAVDIRFGSPTFGKYYSVELNDVSKQQLWIPPGFAHGFSVLSDSAVFSYKCTALYNKESERAILFNDPQLKINWKVADPLVSEKDLHAKLFSEIEKDFHYKIKGD